VLIRAVLLVVTTSLVLPPDSSQASDIVILLSKENRVYRSIADGAAEAAPDAETVVMSVSDAPAALAERLRRQGAKAVLAVGNEAAQWALAEWRGRPAVLAGVIPAFLGQKNVTAPGVRLAVPYATQLAKLKEFFPGVRTVGTVYDPTVNRAMIDDLRGKAQGLGLTLRAEPVEKTNEFAPTLRGMEQGVDAFLVIFDPLLMRPEAFDYLLIFAATQRIPLVVPSFALLKAGATLSVEADYEALGRRSAETARKALAGEAPAGLAAPDAWKVGFNRRTAKSLELRADENAAAGADQVHE
jgi:ABC-type uncharacterized transport system substrate-binding protein